MKKFLTTIALACLTFVAFAQASRVFRPRVEIVEFSSEENNLEMEVFYMNDVSPRMYWLSIGTLGIGTDIIQVNIDPAFELFIPLGGNLDEAISRMEEIKAMYNMPRLWSTEISACHAAAYPNDNLVNVTVTARKVLVSKVLEFSMPVGNEDIVRATFISKGNFGSLLGSLKIYKKLHPKE